MTIARIASVRAALPILTTLFIGQGAVAPGVGAAPARRPAHAANAKSVSLTLTEVHRVLGSALSAGSAGFGKSYVFGPCASKPPVTHYSATFAGPLGTKGVLGVLSDVYTYKSASEASCGVAHSIAFYRWAGDLSPTLGRVTIIHDVGAEAFMVDITSPTKSHGVGVHSLGLTFTRGLYTAVIMVQSNQKIKVADMVRLGTFMDERTKHTRY
ncbi:MAG TPA: hypothetical protein VFB58_04550 [Chloroflexota bacterium]|nr:hypothetical protein [Chloroflexota bacterium]